MGIPNAAPQRSSVRFAVRYGNLDDLPVHLQQQSFDSSFWAEQQRMQIAVNRVRAHDWAAGAVEITDRHMDFAGLHLRGGDLQLHWSENDNHVYMTGPAVEVFSGEWPSS